MSLDPRRIESTPERRRQDRLGALEARLAALERRPVVLTGSGAPTLAARDGTLYVDVVNHRLYVRSAGTWRYATTNP